MEFLGIGPLELLFVVLIAILVIGPKDIGKTARTVGQMLNRLYKSEAWKTLQVASNEVRNLPNRLAMEAEMELEELRELTRVDIEAPDPHPAPGLTPTPDPSPKLGGEADPRPASPGAEESARGGETALGLDAWVRPAASVGDGSKPGQATPDPARTSNT